ncbi:MAG: metalloregulator ArsR/SmtB family transcription factor [Acidobacteriota bacterium]|nr:metalloregulator ArsR/SmtB family transcription factor [Acidobacteriota bacterium]
MGRSLKSADLATLFSALADTTRLRLLNLMAGREVCVCYFVDVLRQSQPKISRHLAYLRKAGIVAARREGKWMHYRICMPAESGAASLLTAVLASLRNDRQMQADLARLHRACCAPQRLVVPEGAPPPVLLSSLRESPSHP